MKSPTIPLVALLIFAIITFLPLVVLFSAPISGLGLSFQPQLLFSSTMMNILRTTLFIGVMTAGLGILPLVLYSWMVTRTDLPGRRFLDSFPIYNRTIPDLVKALGWVILLNPSNGLINQLFRPIIHGTLFNIYTTWGVIFAIILGSIGGNYLFISGTIKNIDPALEEASRTAGHSLLRTFVGVALPSLRQIVLITIIWSFMTAVADFNVPIVMGPPGGFSTLATAIQHDATQTIPPNYGAAATIGIIFLVLTLGTFSVYQYFTRRTFMFQSVRGRVSQRTVHHLTGVGRWAASAYCFAFVFLGFFLPMAALVWLAVTVPGRLLVFSGWSNFADALTIPFAAPAFLNSVILGVVSIIISLPLVTVIAYAIFKTRGISRLAEYLVILPKGIPDIVLSLGIFLMFLTVPFVNQLYGSIVPFVLSIVITTAPAQIIIISGNMVQIGNELEEASRVGGAGWAKTFTSIVTPLAKRSIFNVVQLSFIDSIQSLGAVILLATPSFFVYIVVLLNLFETGDVPLNTVAASSVLLTLFLAACIGLIKLAERFVGERRQRR